MTSELQNLFNQAVENQSQGKDIEALALYRSINAQGVTSPSIELNKSLIFEKQDDWGRALTSIDRAQFLSRNPWLASNKLERIQKEIGANRAYSIGSLGELSGEISKIIRPSESLFVASLLIGFYLIVRGLGFRNRGFLVSLAFSLIFITFSALAFFTSKTKYVIADAELRPLPLEESASKFNIGKGAKVTVLREKGNFSEVERPGDFSGWISSSALKE
jgi:hypothetical protein